MSDDIEAKRMVAAAAPLERAMFLFNQPPGMETPEMRRKASRVLVVSAVLMAFMFWVTPVLMRVSGPVSKLGFFIVLAAYGSAFLLVPASLFRIIFGVTDPNDGNGIVRGMVGFVLFLVTSIGACLSYGFVSR